MFKNATICRFTDGWSDRDALQALLAAEQFSPCGATQQKSTGFVPPRDGGDRLAETVGGDSTNLICMFAAETKTVPPSILNEAVDKVCEGITAETGRVPGKKERRDIRDDQLLALLPQAFPRRQHVPVWFCAERELLVIGSAAWARVDDVVNALVRCEALKTVMPLATATAPASYLASLLHDDIQGGPLSPLDECDLKGSGDEPPTVRLRKVPLPESGVIARIDRGQLPVAARLASEWCEFTLTQTMQLKRIAYPDFEPDPDGDAFDSEVFGETSMLGNTIEAVVQALGGQKEVTG